MIRTTLIFAAMSALGVALACPGMEAAQAADECSMPHASTSTVAQAPGTHAHLLVEGVHCGGTAATVQTALMKVDGVNAVDVDVQGLAEVAFDPSKTNVGALIATIGKLDGYSAKVADEALVN